MKLGNLCAWNIHEMQIFHPPLHAIYFSLKIVRIYLHLPDRKEFLPFWWSSLSHSPKMVQNDRVPFLILEFCEIASKIFLFLHSKLNFCFTAPFLNEMKSLSLFLCAYLVLSLISPSLFLFLFCFFGKWITLWVILCRRLLSFLFVSPSHTHSSIAPKQGRELQFLKNCRLGVLLSSTQHKT